MLTLARTLTLTQVMKRFGPDVTEAFCAREGLQLIIRSHQFVAEGVKFMHSGRLVTVFSARNCARAPWTHATTPCRNSPPCRNRPRAPPTISVGVGPLTCPSHNCCWRWSPYECLPASPPLRAHLMS